MTTNIHKYNGVEWSLPLLFQHEPIWDAIYRSLKNFDITIPKVNLFGSPSNIWTGGRAPAIYKNINEETLINTFKYLKKINATPTFTFTSTQLTKEDLKDEYANFLLDIALENDARFIVYSDILRDYIKEKKSDACTVASVIKSNFRFQGPNKIEEPTVEKETNYYNKLLKEYDIVVVRPEYSITTLTEHPEYIDDISRIEVMINQPCIYNCPMMPEHYRFLEKLKLKPKINERFQCIRKDIPKNILLENTLAHPQKIVEKLVYENGVKNLKLQGRGTDTPICSLIHILSNLMFNQDGNGYQIFAHIHKTLEISMQNFQNITNNYRDTTVCQKNF